MMLFFAGAISGIPLWLIVGWVMRGDSYTRHYVPVSVPAPQPVPAPVPVAALAAPAVVHVHLSMPSAPERPMVIQPERWEIEG